ncbi:MAG: hypothetical protein IJC25_04155 [Clostridia bacterium]|nr:hypothetical protein [Clostridia bacterium]
MTYETVWDEVAGALSEEAADEVTDDVLDKVVEEVLEEATDDVLDEVVEEVLEEATDDVLDEVVEEVLDEVTEDVSDGAVEVTVEGVAAGKLYIMVPLIMDGVEEAAEVQPVSVQAHSRAAVVFAREAVNFMVIVLSSNRCGGAGGSVSI